MKFPVKFSIISKEETFYMHCLLHSDDESIDSVGPPVSKIKPKSPERKENKIFENFLLET